MLSSLKKRLPALVLLAALVFTGCLLDLGDPRRNDGQQSQPAGGVLTVKGVKNGTHHEAAVYDYPDDDVADAADLKDLMSRFELVAVGLGTAGNKTLALGLVTLDGDYFTADGDFLVVITKVTKDDNAPFKYKGAVPFSGGNATVEYNKMETATRLYTVTFDLNYTDAPNPPKPQEIDADSKVTPPDAPVRTDGYFFEGWFTQASGGTEYIFSSPVTADIALYAKWTDEIKTVAIADEYLASKSANTADGPILLKMNLAIADNWNALVTTLASRTKYAALDLSACSMSGTAFDLYSGDVTGKNYIVSLILPDAATSIANSSSGNSTYSDNDSRYYNDSYFALRTVSGANITTIGEYVFQNCTAMTAASFPKATDIGGYAFRDCKALTTAPFPKATAIGKWAFEGCEALTSVDFPKAVTIGEQAFVGAALTAVSFPETTYIGDHAFFGCKALTSVDFPKAVTIENSAFSGGTPLTSVSFPEATTVKGSFMACKSLTSVSFPKATNFEFRTFSGCTSLTSVSLPEATNIGYGTFIGCTALTAVSIPKVTSFGDRVFGDCGTTPLTVTMGAAAPTVGAEMFYESDLAVTAAKSVTVRVPTGATGYDTAWQNAFSSGRTFGTNTSHVTLVMQYY